ncbi:L-glyceraldehyde 3-phosphate reductase [Lactiplantibacillus plantarum subsp. plantarum]|uniref:aldo/keto reductase n=3 Tax=Lactiplantibacillus plantarum TaxID=1590 RepID=UPI00048A33B2|nr:aldo/keto reductase [Lactiplantibacillus plantarum]MCS6091958.1 L-glyceraldehyde 3-phosphate reductase [Lactobacillus sp. LMY-20]AOG32816.1 L-glyceraldehyde 3-phosphate reductase [Lactiplantibacillus plantarum]AQX94948.1 L-glyceraldehyde 3-phosphate reductase [Lactiplantibacillus plantarum]ARO01910.1 L-glyceraldehyde 3-phosphate reductase [Lactiplantibacillus plantarum]ARO04817.1 L-glyceraldehyde 3-phosphate reductase [Lactiplantibacillus plantarum]
MYQASQKRYDHMIYNRVGNSGLKLSAIGLGLWNNFGSVDPIANQKAIIHQAFDLGITYYDLANNYGPEPGSAETNFGRIMATDMRPYRDEMVIASKAGYVMWPGPYGNWGSRKSIIASADQSLQRTGLDYFDIFYSHRPDPETPMEETAAALDQLVRQGKTLYVGISNYNGKQTAAMTKIFESLGTPYIIHQPRYNMFNRQVEQDLFPVLQATHKAAVGFSSLSQGLLTDKYLHGITTDSRANKQTIPFLNPVQVEQTLATVKRLNEVAQQREQSLAQMALAWNLRQPALASVLIGASRPEQVVNNVAALEKLKFSESELATIEQILTEQPAIDWNAGRS